MTREEVEQQCNAANKYANSRQYAEAREIFEKILPFADEEMRQYILPRIPFLWYFEGMQYFNTLKFNQSVVCMEHSRNGFHEIGNVEYEIEALCQIADAKKYLYDTAGAFSDYKQACSLAVANGKDAKLMSIFSKQRKLYEQLGNSKQVLRIGARMDSLAAFTTDNKVRFEYYNHWGDEAKGQGNFVLAEQWYRKNEPYINKLEDNYIGADRYIYYAKLRDLFTSAGELDKALDYALLVRSESWKLVDKTDKIYYSPYSFIAEIYRKKGDSLRCFHNLDTLFVSLDLFDEPREKQQLYVTRARCHSAFKNYKQALADYRKADSLLATKYGENDGDRIMLLPLMGGAEHKLGRYVESERLYRKYADNIRKLQGENGLEYIDALDYLANAEAFAGHITAACSDYATAVETLKQQIRNRFPYMTAAVREGYWNAVSSLVLNMSPFALEAGEFQTAFTMACYDGLVLSKAFLLASECSTYDLIKNNGTEQDLRDFTLISDMRSVIGKLERNRGKYSDSILALTAMVRNMETELAVRCRKYGDVTAFINVGYKEIKEKLNGNDVLIDFTDFVSESKGRIYSAYLIDSKQKYPILKKLFAESRIDSMQVPYPDMFFESPYAESLYQLLWMPFKKHVKEGATVYYVPSQLLFQIALESIPLEDGSLLGEHYRFVRLSSARELIKYDSVLNIDRASVFANAILYGGLKYDLDTGVMEAESKKYDIAPLLAFRGDIRRGDSLFRELPGSKKEVDAIERILTAHQLTVKSYTGKSGTEESFLSMNGKAPQILQIATHGFFYTPDSAQKIAYLRGYQDAMSLSGLVMSGGNAAWLGRELPKGVLGGILTASSIARMDLSGNQLTVLSACKSGRGKATSEGLYGLQRAFKKAGVQTIIMSIWDVDDAVGTEFMTLFYEYLLDKDNCWNKRAAFEKAKSAIREKYHEPFYWAGFVMLD